MADNFLKKAIKHPGALTAIAKRMGAWDEKTQTINAGWLRKQASKGNTTLAKQARLALSMRKMG